MPLTNCEINLIWPWWSTYVINSSIGEGQFEMTDSKLYVPVVTLSTQDNAKLLQQLKASFKRTISWNKYQSKIITEGEYLDFLIDRAFQGVNRLFVLSFENKNDRTAHTRYYISKVEITDYIVKINDKNFFNQPINNDIKTYENIRKITTG